MRYTEIDGKRYEVRACNECPFRDMGDAGYAAHCTHPNAEPYMDDQLWIEDDGISVSDRCPLREVQAHRPCPFCGSTSLSEVCIDDTGEELEQWMMDDANRESKSDGSMGYDSWDEFVHINAEYYYIKCDNCSAGVISKKGIEDAWAKWDRRAF